MGLKIAMVCFNSIPPSSDTHEHGLEQMDTLVGMVTDLDLVHYIAHSGRSKSGSGQKTGSSTGPDGSSSSPRSSLESSYQSSSSAENPASDCPEEISSDGTASH